MRRRSQKPADSLELLLDTICNTFGGILFIAILIVILLQLSGSSARATRVDALENSAEVRNLESELADLKSRQHSLAKTVQGQQATLELLAPADIQAMLAERDRDARRNEELRLEIASIAQQLSERQTSREEMQASLQASREMLANSDADRARLQKELNDLKAAQRKELRTSIVRAPGDKVQVIVVMEYDRLYFWHRYDAVGRRGELNTADFIVLDNNPLGTETAPNPTAGIVVDGSPKSRQQILASVQRFQPSRAYFAVIVRPDSFDSFHHVRDAIVEMNFDYELVPTVGSDLYLDRGGSGGRVQ